jgi:hypothetical protein
MNAHSGDKVDIMSKESEESVAAKAPIAEKVFSTLLSLLTFKAAFFVVALIMVQFFSIWDEAQFRQVRHWPHDGESKLSSRFATWDAAHYLFLAQKGYQKDDLSCAFYPLWPALIRLGSYVTGDVFSAGLVLANIFSIAAILLFWRLVLQLHGSELATLSTVLLLVFPGSIFLSFIYTESLFLFLLALFFLFLFRDNLVGASIVGFFLPLTKAIGIFCLVPLLWRCYFDDRRPARQIFAGYGPTAGYATYFLIMYYFTGDAFEGFKAQQHYFAKPSIGKIFDLGLNFRAFFCLGDFPASAVDILNRIFFVVYLASLPGIWRLNKTLCVYAVLAGVVPALSASFYSFTRNVATCLPMFIGLAFYIHKCRYPVVRWLTVAVLLGIQLFLLFYYLNARFAG